MRLHRTSQIVHFETHARTTEPDIHLQSQLGVLVGAFKIKRGPSIKIKDELQLSSRTAGHFRNRLN